MKRKLLRLFCAVLGVIALLSAVPVWAENTTTSGETSALLDATIDFETGKVVSYVNGTAPTNHPKLSAEKTAAGDISGYFNTSDIAVFTPADYRVNYHCFIQTDPKISGNYALRVESARSYFAVQDINKKLPDGDFTVSADFYFTLANFGGTVPIIQWARDEKLKGDDSSLANKYALVSADASGHLVANSQTLDVTLSNETWYNITVEAKYISEDNYKLSLYLGDELVATYMQSMPEPASGANNSYLIFFTYAIGCKYSYVDNIHIYEWITSKDEIDPDRLDTTIDFENLTADQYTTKTWLNTANLAPLNIEGKTSFSTSQNANGGGMNAAIMDDEDASHGRVWYNASAAGHYTLHDLGNRLITHDYTVSADFKFTTFPKVEIPLISWLRGTSTSSYAASKLICINQKGRFSLDSVDLGKGVALNEWFNVTVKVSYISYDLYRVTVYVNGELISSEEIEFACKSGDTDNSFIRILNKDNGFKARFDNLQVYESDNAKIYPEKSVIWDVDFNAHENGSLMSIDDWKYYSSGYNVVRSNLGESAVVENGKLKLTPRSSDNSVDIKIGEGNFDPIKEGPVAISMKLNVATGETVGSQKLLVWRRVLSDSELDSPKTAPILVLENEALSFMGRAGVYQIEENKDYDIKVILDGNKLVASLVVNGVTIFDSISIAAYASSRGMLGENMTYVTDDAGNVYKLPYSGLVYQQNGTDDNGDPVYVRRFVESAGYGVDTLRMFQASGSDATAVFYVDDFKVEQIDDNLFISTDFTGWSRITDKTPLNTNQTKYGHINFVADTSASSSNVPLIKTDADGNEYLSGYGVARMFINDPANQLLHNNFELSFDLAFSQENATATDGTKKGFLSIVSSHAEHIPFITDSVSKNNKYDHLLYTSYDGKLYDINANLLYDKLLENPWTNIRIVVEGDGTKLNVFKYYVDGIYVKTVEVTDMSKLQNDTATNVSIRFVPQGPFTMGLDNVKLSYVTKTDDMILDFDGDYTSMLDIMGAEFKYPAIDSTRTDANGGTVVSAQVLGDDDKFLRIDRTLLAADQEGSIVIDNSKYIDEKEYVVETDFRLSCDAGFGITPVTIVSKRNEKQFAPVQVRGAVNTLYMSMRGASYDLCDAEGNLLKVKTTNDSGFTKLAILINENELTYTVYVDGRVAYYCYKGEYIPCANVPIRYESTGLSTNANAGLKLMEIDSIKHNYSIIDIDRVAVTPAPSGLASNFRAIQSKIDISKQTFDLRFISGVDSLYGNLVGYIVETTYVDGTEKNAKKEFTSNKVFSSVVDDTKTVNASDLNSNYLFVMSVTSLPITADGISFKVTPFVEHGGVRDLGATESFVVTVVNGKFNVK